MSSSMRCPGCGFLNWSTAESCKRCQIPFVAAVPDGAAYPAESYAPPADQAFAAPPAAPPESYATSQAPPGWGGGYSGGAQTSGGYATGGYSGGGYASAGQSGAGYASGGYSSGGYSNVGGYSSRGYSGGGYSSGGGYAGGGYSSGGGGGYSGGGYGYGTGGQSGSFPYALDVPPSKGTAIASLVLGAMSLPLLMLCGAGALTGIAGMITGFVALSKAKKQPQLYAGRGMALGGVITSAAAVLLCAIIIPAIAIPNLLASRRAANEGSAMSAMRTIHGAEMTYAATTGRGRYGTLQELAQASLIDSSLASGQKTGYRFRITVTDSDFSATAVPESYGSTGNRSFYVSSSGVLRAANKHGLEAGESDEAFDPTRGQYGSGSSSSSEPYPPTPVNFEPPSEASAISSLRTLHSAEVTYQATSGNGSFGTLEQLRAAGLIDDHLGAGSKGGYDFRLGAHGSRFEVVAVPMTNDARSFYISQDGVIRAPTSTGGEAGAFDPPIDR